MTVTTQEFRAPAARADELTYREATLRDRDAILRVLGERYSPAWVAARAAIWEWQFGRNPHDDGRAPFVVAEAGGQVVGVNGQMPVWVRYRGVRRRLSWDADMAVDSRFRRRGIGARVLGWYESQTEVALAYGFNDMSEPFLVRNEWHASTETASYFLHAREPGLAGALKNARSRAAALLGSGAERGLAITERRDAFGDEVTRLFARCAPGYDAIVERDGDYLRWRYQEHPLLRYAAYEARRGEQLLGVLIARHDPAQSVIADYVGPAEDRALMTALLRHASAELVRRGTTRVLCETTHAAMRDALTRAGFVRARTSPRFRALSRIPGDTEPARGWFLMTGDSDNDMLAASEAP